MFTSPLIGFSMGLTTLAMAESIMLKVNGVPVSGDPIETVVGETVRDMDVTEAAGGEETINVEVELQFQPGQPFYAAPQPTPLRPLIRANRLPSPR